MRPPVVKRRNGRPRGTRDRYGKARRVAAPTVATVMRAFAEQLRYVRTSASVSVSELAHAIGVLERTVHSYESGRILPPLHRLVAISMALGLPVDHLVPEV